MCVRNSRQNDHLPQHITPHCYNDDLRRADASYLGKFILFILKDLFCFFFVLFRFEALREAIQHLSDERVNAFNLEQKLQNHLKTHII